MNSTAFADAVSTVVVRYASGDAGCRAGDMAEAMATVPTIARADIIRAVVCYLMLSGHMREQYADSLTTDLTDATTR